MRKELFNNSESKTKRIRKLNYEPFVYVFEQDLESILVSSCKKKKVYGDK